MQSKFDYQRLLDEIKTVKSNSIKDTDLKNLNLKKVFANYRNGRGLRLTKFGYVALRNLKYQSYQIPITSGTLKPWQKIVLDNEMEWPYFIETKDKSITLFNELDYMDLKMFDGDMKLWCNARRI